MGFLTTLGMLSLLASPHVILVALLIGRIRRDEERKPWILESWIQDNDLTLLSYRLSWLQTMLLIETTKCKMIYRVTVVDREGIRWTGRAVVEGRMTVREEYLPLAVELKLNRPRAVARPARALSGPLSQPLWDDIVDAGCKPLTRNVDC